VKGNLDHVVDTEIVVVMEIVLVLMVGLMLSLTDKFAIAQQFVPIIAQNVELVFVEFVIVIRSIDCFLIAHAVPVL